jgi:hypothetical protein
MTKVAYTVALVLLLVGCGGGGSSDEGLDSQNDSTSLDISLPPPAEYNITRYKPTTDTSWQWQLTGVINTSYSVDLYDIDLFDTSIETIEALKADGKRVICYFSAGSFEEWREDSGEFPNEALGSSLDGWDGERWLDIRNLQVREIMRSRLDLAKTKGCDGVEPDNVDGYDNSSGFDLSYQNQLDYNIFIANEAHKRGLSIGLKNDYAQARVLEPYFDFSLSEECFKNSECNYLTSFIDSDKPVFNVEYDQEYVTNSEAREQLCQKSRELKFQTLVLPMELDDTFRYSCQ